VSRCLKVFGNDLINPELGARVPATGQQDLVLGPFRLDCRSRSLSRDGVPVSVGGRALDILVALAAASGATVGKNALLDQVWPGQIVEENNLQVQISALRKTLGEGWIVTVPGRGYKLVAPLATVAPPPTDGLAGKPSIAVLPFVNMSGDPEQEYFADGMAEEITTALSRVRSFFVIARNSSFTYKGRAVDVRQVGRELGVRYVVEGGVRRDGDRIRITAQLIDAETGSHIWAERYDRELAYIFAVQDEIAGAMLAAVAPAISQAERQRAMQKPPESLSAWEAYQRALSHWWEVGDLSTSRDFLKQAVALDPRFASAHAMLAHLYTTQTSLGTGLPLRESVRLAEAGARAALELDPDNAVAHAMLAWVFGFQGDQASALDEAAAAIALNPNEPFGHLIKGRTLVFSGRVSEALVPLATALRLDPRGVTARGVMMHRLIGSYFERDYLAAEVMARRTIRAHPQMPRPYPWLAAALGQLGRPDEAGVALNAAIAASRSFFDFITRSRPPYYFRPQDHEHLLDGLRKAGWQG
jgi:adenylate cyclase